MTGNGREGDTFEALLRHLSDPDAPIPAALVYRLSDPTPEDLASLKSAWSQIPSERRRQLLVRLAETSEASFEVDFSAVAQFALQDEDSTVRRYAIAALWEREDAATMQRFIQMLQSDEASEVRAAAAEALGKFVLAGELGDFPETSAREAEDALLGAYYSSDEPIEVRQRALESAAYSGRDEIVDVIEEARTHHDARMQATAIFAMGRSADERWARYVIAALDDAEPEMRFEAARAAGELGLSSTVSRLIRMANEADREIKEAAIWSLGEIGGSEAQTALLRLADREEDDELLQVIEDAVNTAALATGELTTYLLSLNDDEEEDYDYLDEDDTAGDD